MPHPIPLKAPRRASPVRNAARFVAVLLALQPAAAGLAAEPGALPAPGKEVRFSNGDLALAGMWFAPTGEGPFPAAVIVSGSGPSDRDNPWVRAFVDALLANRVAVLVPDKRGSDGSGGDWRSASFDDLAADARAAVGFVRARPEVRDRSVGLVGLSQGGKIVPVAAAGRHDVAFVMDFAGASTNFVEQISWEMYHTLREAGLEGESLQTALTLQVLAEKYVLGEVTWDKYAAARDAALAEPWAEVAEGFPAAPDSWQWAFFRRVADFDPLPYWREVRQPVLVVYGEDDSNAPAVRSTYRLVRAFVEQEHPDWTVRVLPGTGHGLWDPASTDPRGLHPALVALLREWIGARFTDGERRGS